MVKEMLEKFNDNIMLITIVSIFNKISILNNKYKLQKNIQKSNIVILDGPILFDKPYNGEVSNKYKKDAKEQLEFFIEQIEKHISKENLTRMYNNLSTLKMEERNLYLIVLSKIKFPFSKGIIGGGYFVNKNKMTTYSRDGLVFVKRLLNSKSEMTLEGIYSHELLHMSSSSKNAGKWCSGFNHYYAPFHLFTVSSIGMGINEGYTELLNERIFGVENKGGIYEFYKEAARLVESVIEKEKMTNMYFSNDLKGLINELSIYVPEKETKSYILNLDRALKDHRVIQNVLNYLVILVNNKIQHDLKNNLISNEDAIKKYNELKRNIENMTNIINEMEKKKNKFNGIINFNTDYNSILETYNESSHKSRGNINFITFYLIAIILFIIIIFFYINYII